MVTKTVCKIQTAESGKLADARPCLGEPAVLGQGASDRSDSAALWTSSRLNEVAVEIYNCSPFCVIAYDCLNWSAYYYNLRIWALFLLYSNHIELIQTSGLFRLGAKTRENELLSNNQGFFTFFNLGQEIGKISFCCLVLNS